MEYSFSQTFGKGAIILQSSPAPSRSSNKENSRKIFKNQSQSINRSMSRSKSIDQANDRSPVIESYPSKQIINMTPKSFDRALFLHNHLRENKNCSNQSTYRQLSLQKQIINVDGLNERMVNLLKQLRQDNKFSKFGRFNKDTKTPQIKNKSEYGSKIDRSYSYKSIKPQALNQKKYIYEGLRQNILQKKLINKYQKKQPTRIKNQTRARMQQEENNLASKYKNKYDSRTNVRNVSLQKFQSTKGKNIVDINLYYKQKMQLQKNGQKYGSRKNIFIEDKRNLANENLRGKAHNSQMYEIKKIKQTEKKFGGSCEVYLKDKQGKNFLYQKYKQGPLKNKVKTIQSQIQTNYLDLEAKMKQDYIQQVSYVEQQDQNQNIIQSIKKNQTIAFKKQFNEKLTKNCEKCFACGKQKSINANQNANLNEQQKNHQSTNRSQGFQLRIKQISQKIENYQKKITKMNIGLPQLQKVCQKNKQNGLITQKSSKVLATIQQNKNLKLITDKNQQIKQDTGHKWFIDLKKPQVGHQRTITPTWGFQFPNEKQTNNFQSKNFGRQGSNYEKNNTTNFIKNTQSNKSQKKIVNSQSTKQINKKIQQKQGLKQRMNQKLGITCCAERFVKQIQLDQHLRKIKKQFTKLPQSMPKITKNKWYYLQITLKAQVKSHKSTLIKQKIGDQQIKQIFFLSDEQADPFFSIAVQDIRDFDQIINQLVEAYINAEEYFNKNIMSSFTNQELQSIFQGYKKDTDIVRLDQLTLKLSNSTKINHKCRDIYLVFKRFLQYLHIGKAKSKDILEENITFKQLKLILCKSETNIKQNETQTIRIGEENHTDKLTERKWGKSDKWNNQISSVSSFTQSLNTINKIRLPKERLRGQQNKQNIKQQS